jgi:PAS domain S-box-containing protein
MNHELIFRHTADAILVCDRSWTVTAANPRAETLLLRSGSALIGRPLREWVPDLADSRAEPELEQIATGTIERRVEHFSPSRYVWFEIRAVPDAGGTVLFMRDVTDRAREVRTEAVREAVREIVASAPVAISITRGPEHRYELVNNLSRELIGDRNVEGLTARNAFPEVDPALFDLLDQVYRTGEPISIKDLEVEFLRNGVMRKGWFDVSYQPLRESDGSVSGIMSVSLETTDRVLERQREARQG